jgi:hypothetical protein
MRSELWEKGVYEIPGLRIETWGTQRLALKGHGFSRAVNAAKSTLALAPEEMFLYTQTFPKKLRKRLSTTAERSARQ